VARLDAGPQAVAAAFRDGDGAQDRIQATLERSQGALVERGGRLVWSRSAETDAQRLENAAKMLRFIAQVAQAARTP
jgi:hypothetical protein